MENEAYVDFLLMVNPALLRQEYCPSYPGEVLCTDDVFLQYAQTPKIVDMYRFSIEILLCEEFERIRYNPKVHEASDSFFGIVRYGGVGDSLNPAVEGIEPAESHWLKQFWQNGSIGICHGISFRAEALVCQIHQERWGFFEHSTTIIQKIKIFLW